MYDIKTYPRVPIRKCHVGSCGEMSNMWAPFSAETASAGQPPTAAAISSTLVAAVHRVSER